MFPVVVGVEPFVVEPCAVGERFGVSGPSAVVLLGLGLPYLSGSLVLSSVRRFVLFVPLESVAKGEGGGGVAEVNVPSSCSSSFCDDPLGPV